MCGLVLSGVYFYLLKYDVASPDYHPIVKKSKDMAAGAVLIAAIGSIVIGLIVFLPYVKSYV